jgi:hypothetical protein
MADLTIVVSLFERLHSLAMRDAERQIATINAQALVAIEAERSRCSMSLDQTREHWAALRNSERETRAELAAVANDANARDELDADDLAERVAIELADRQPQQQDQDAAQRLIARLGPIVEQLAPVVLPKLAAWLGAGSGTLQGSEAAGT